MFFKCYFVYFIVLCVSHYEHGEPNSDAYDFNESKSIAANLKLMNKTRSILNWNFVKGKNIVSFRRNSAAGKNTNQKKFYFRCENQINKFSTRFDKRETKVISK